LQQDNEVLAAEVRTLRAEIQQFRDATPENQPPPNAGP
jgi:hypothetical protein